MTLTTVIRESKQLYFSDRLKNSEKDSIKIWQVINDILKPISKKKIQECFKETSGNVITDPEVIANKFNAYFVNIGIDSANETDLNIADCITNMKGSYTHSLFLKPIEQYEILDIVRCMENWKSPGHDDLDSTILKQIIDVIVLPLQYIFNLSFESGKVPKSFKLAKVIPIFKKGQPNEFGNYRPISVLPVLSKILERLFYVRFYSYLEKNKILSHVQYGFRTGHSTILALADFLDQIMHSLDESKHTVGLYLDISKAFDSINHMNLLAKLAYYGIRGLAYNWIQNYLTDRKQYVVFNNVCSHELQLSCGIPQGSILGPLLFLIYINDLPNVSNALSYVIFADDTNVFLSETDLDSLMYKMKTEIGRVLSWFRMNGLRVNLSKTNYMHFVNPNKHFDKSLLDIKIGHENESIKQVTHTRFLGVNINDRLMWTEHINEICLKISKVLGVMSKLKHTLPSYTLLMLYNSLILPHLSYANMLWACSSQGRMNRLHLLQKRALRIIEKTDYIAHILGNIKS